MNGDKILKGLKILWSSLFINLCFIASLLPSAIKGYTLAKGEYPLMPLLQFTVLAALGIRSLYAILLRTAETEILGLWYHVKRVPLDICQFAVFIGYVLYYQYKEISEIEYAFPFLAWLLMYSMLRISRWIYYRKQMQKGQLWR